MKRSVSANCGTAQQGSQHRRRGPRKAQQGALALSNDGPRARRSPPWTARTTPWCGARRHGRQARQQRAQSGTTRRQLDGGTIEPHPRRVRCRVPSGGPGVAESRGGGRGIEAGRRLHVDVSHTHTPGWLNEKVRLPSASTGSPSRRADMRAVSGAGTVTLAEYVDFMPGLPCVSGGRG